MHVFMFFFFFQAEDGIRDKLVTGVQTCALPISLGWALANAGDRAGAEAILAALTRESQSSYVSPVGFATIHLGLGNREPALAYTEKALVERRGWLAYLKTNPILDQLRPE